MSTQTNKLNKPSCALVEWLVLGMLSNNTYIIGNDKLAFVVDPSCEAQRIFKALGSRRLEAIVVTHGHWDHIGALVDLHELSGAPVIAGKRDTDIIEGTVSSSSDLSRPFDPCKVDYALDDGDEIVLANMLWHIIETPGHTPGSICLYSSGEPGEHPSLENELAIKRAEAPLPGQTTPQKSAALPFDPKPANKALPLLISGDTLFAHNRHGRCDFEGGSLNDMMHSLARLALLPPETVVLPGHEETTTIAQEQSWLKSISV